MACTPTVSSRWPILLVATATWVGTTLWCGLGLGGFGARGAKLFNWHPVLASTAMLLLLPHGLFAWRSETSDRRRTKLFHGCVLSSAFVLLNAAVGVAYFSHVQQGLSNFYSVHSWVGMLAIGTMKGNVLGGILTTFFRFVRELKFVGKMHRGSGILGTILGFVAVVLGFAEQQTFVVRQANKAFTVVSVTGALLGIASLGVGLLVLREMALGREAAEEAVIDKLVDDGANLKPSSTMNV